MKLTDQELKRKAAKVLVKAGFSYREVAKLVGYGSTRSVALAVNKGETHQP